VHYLLNLIQYTLDPSRVLVRRPHIQMTPNHRCPRRNPRRPTPTTSPRPCSLGCVCQAVRTRCRRRFRRLPLSLCDRRLNSSYYFTFQHTGCSSLAARVSFVRGLRRCFKCVCDAMLQTRTMSWWKTCPVCQRRAGFCSHGSRSDGCRHRECLRSLLCSLLRGRLPEDSIHRQV